MRRALGVFAAFGFLVTTLFPLLQTKAQELPEGIWDGGITVEEVPFPTDPSEQVHNFCTLQTFTTRYIHDFVRLTGNKITLTGASYETEGRTEENICAYQNESGIFGNDMWAEGTSTDAARLVLSDTAIYPAPASNVVISERLQGTGFNQRKLSINYNFRPGIVMDLGVRIYGSGSSTQYEKAYLLDTSRLSPALEYADGSIISFDARKIGYSANGQFAVVYVYRRGYALLNLQTQAFTPFMRNVSTQSTNVTFAVSNDGRYATTSVGASVLVHDLIKCGSYSPGMLPTNAFDSLLASCMGRELGPIISPLCTTTVFNRERLNRFGNKLHLDARCANGDSSFTSKRFLVYPTNFPEDPAPEGYLALGDSFSSGEGDTEGETWYEPGTDEQGDKSTFANRNLCHLSRRSYPYLMAKQLGYLAGVNNEPITPSSGEQFHSIACSGALTGNIIGFVDGLLYGEGNEDAFVERDNQYRNDYLGSLGKWQPGHDRQLSFLDSNTSAGLGINNVEPAIITLGIAGNDAGFGDTINSCVISVGTCKYAVEGSPDAQALAARIANLKSQLVKTYTQVKNKLDKTRLYVHGYPQFIQPGGNCAINVRLNDQEVRLVDEGIQYMNAVVEAAAAEAGVFYVDVSDILINRNLCSFAPDDEIAFNGVTAGDDISSKLLNFLTADICRIRSG